MPDWKAYKFWAKAKGYCERKMRKAWFSGGNCDSCCPKCRQWESLGNRITTVSRNDGCEHRKCSNCEYTWLAIFTPAGFIPVADMRQQGEGE